LPIRIASLKERMRKIATSAKKPVASVDTAMTIC